jgi:hypothetical protein
VISPLAHACVEGALARISGVDRSENPYDRTIAPDSYETWRWSWLYADRWLELNIGHYAGAWLNEDEAA